MDKSQRHRIAKAARYEKAKRDARNGNPLPFIREQWPQLLVTDPFDQKHFERACLRNSDTDLRLDDFQIDILKSAFDPSMAEVFIKGCTKPGKGFAVAMLANIWFDVFDDARIVVTSVSQDHAEKTIFAEICQLRRMMQHPVPANVLASTITDPQDKKHIIRVANPVTGEGFSGGHSDHVAFLFDEASGIADDLYENAQKQSRIIVALSNPRVLSGWFRFAFPKREPDKTQTIRTPMGGRRLITVGGMDCMNVRDKRLERPFAPDEGYTAFAHLGGDRARQFEPGEPIPDNVYKHIRPLIPKQMDYARYKAIMATTDENKRNVFGAGQFPREDADLQVILGSWLDRHVKAWKKCDGNVPVEAFALDVSASADGDQTILAAGGVGGVRALHPIQRADTMQMLADVHRITRNEYQVDLNSGDVPIAVDMDGLGLSVGNRLAESGVSVVEIRGNSPADYAKERYANKRAQLWGELGRRLDPDGEFPEPWALPDDHFLLEELVAPEKIYLSDGVKFRITPKYRSANFKGMTLRQILGRSPDRGDATGMLYEAVRELAGNKFLVDQFNPSGALETFRPLSDGTFLCEFMDGSQSILEGDEFERLFGTGALSLQTTIDKFRETGS